MTSTPQPFQDASQTPPVRGFLHSPDKPNGCGLVLTHGAGANCDSLLLRAVANAFVEAGYTVLRCDLAFRQQRRFGPPRGSGSEDRASLRSAVLALRQLVTGPIFIGGHSYGGRQASMLAAEDQAIATGLLLLSYPLHPPRKPQQLRTAHFASLRVPAVFVQGTRDSFGSIAELDEARALIAAPTTLLPIDGAGHDLSFGRKVKTESPLPQEVVTVFHSFLKTALPADIDAQLPVGMNRQVKS